MPFCKRIVRPVQLCRWSGEDRRLSALENLIDVSSFTLGSVLRQLSALAREAVSVLEEIELEIGSISHRALLLEVRIIGLHRYVSALALRPAVPSGSNLEQESKRTAHFKSLWQQNVNVFSSSSRPPCVEELHQEAQLNLQALLQEEFGEPIVQNEVAANTFGHKPVLNREAVPDSCPRKGEKRMEFVLMPSTRSSSEDETTTIGIRPQELFLNSPSTPEKPHKWIQPISPSTPEEKRWHHMRTTQVDLIPINVTETAMNPKSMLRRRRTVTGLHESNQPQQGLSTECSTSPHTLTAAEAPQRLFNFDEDLSVTNGKRDSVSNVKAGQSFPTMLRKVQSDLGQITNPNLSQSSGNITFTMNNAQMMHTSLSDHSFSSLNSSWDQMRGISFSSSWNNSNDIKPPNSVSSEAMHADGCALETFSQTYCNGQSLKQHAICSSTQKQLLPHANTSSPGDPCHCSDNRMEDHHHPSSGACNGSTSTCAPQTSDVALSVSLQCLKHSSPCDSELSLNAGSHSECNVPLSTFLPREGQAQNSRSNAFGSFTSAKGETATRTPNLKDIRSNHERIIIYTTNDPDEETNSNLELQGHSDTSTCKFRERSLSTPTDSGSCCSSDAVRSYDSKCYDHTRRHSENYIMRYPSASSEESQSTENVSVITDQEESQKSRARSRSISLKKPKKKPIPPVRSVSLKKYEVIPKLEEIAPSISPEEIRPIKLFLHPEKQINQSESIDSNESSGFVSDARSSSATPTLRDGEPIRYPEHWFLNDWKSNDPYRSLSNSSTATGITVIECAKSRGSSESLTSPSISRATTPSQLSVEVESKMTSPGKLPGLMSPSSGYSSQPETPTSAFPMSVYQGHVIQPVGKPKPKVPERKSSLQPTSPNEKSPRSKHVFDLPITPPPHLDLSGLKLPFKGKSKASRRHSDSSNSTKLSQKHSPNQPSMPIITQTVLESVRLRSVSRSETEDNSKILISPQKLHTESSELPEKKVRPPVPGKPPMSKRPSSIVLKISPTEHPTHITSPPSEATSKRGFVTGVFRKVGVKRQESIESVASQKPPLASPKTTCPQSNNLQSNHMHTKQTREIPDTTDDSPGESFAALTRSSTQYTEKKKTPPPVPKKPNVLIVPTNTAHILVVTERPGWSPQRSPAATPDSNSANVSLSQVVYERDLEVSNMNVSHDWKTDPSVENIPCTSVHSGDSRKKQCNDGFGLCQNIMSSTARGQNPTDISLNPAAKQKSPTGTQSGDIVVEDDDDVFISSGTQRSTEDLFTVIHRSKRKVLGWKEPGEVFNVRHVAVSPVKPPTTPPSSGLKVSPSASGNGIKVSTSNENFKALLQKKGSKPASGTRMSAAELLKSTNPLARRIATEFTQELERCQPILDPVSSEDTSKC
ncbi:NHS-like protein 2 isoform X2 [Hemiscyllium ocellatum]|uniref:NHS-like protein 2 isoform X2 n=1 Tax=Hemiscyllium ocellatum TaxID=170820 RepID=UPI002966781F|nr:NHS-like protein 2 isoform X2 [Hemiscyllium ocellatum]